MPFFRKRSDRPEKRPPVRHELSRLVREHLPSADEEDVRIATAIAGLFSVVAYADRHFAPEEQTQIRQDLTRLPMFDEAAAAAVCALLKEQIVELSTGNSQSYTRDLRELLDPSGREDVLQVLVDLAAADGEIAQTEADSLRRITAALGLPPDAYVVAQNRHRDRLASLK